MFFFRYLIIFQFELSSFEGVSATLNVGWKANKEAWIKPGDYMTDTHYGVRIEDKKQDYRRDITLVKY